MATLPCSTTKTLTLSSPSIFLESYRAFSKTSPPQTSPPLSFSLLSQQSPLPHIPIDDFPHSKLIPKTRFIVDGFRNSGNYSISYFLSHFHSDHYAGLNPSWSRGLIFCSEITARLLIEVLKISPFFVVSLSLQEPVCIDECEVTLIDANHCPGAVQVLFKTPEIRGKYKRYVHTGDFRFCNSMKLEHMLSEFVGADAIFLDTTYCNPKFSFPSQDESVDYIVETIERIRVENKGLGNKSVLFLIATYMVGKERILVEVSHRCNCLIHVDRRKMALLCASFGEEEHGIFTEDASLSDVHVIGWNVLGETWPYFRPNFTKMKEIMIDRGYSKAVGFVPTGWMYEVKRDGFAMRSKDSFEIHLVPYSEHSSYDELREYVRFLKPKRVIPTVGLDVEKLDSKYAIAMRKHFADLVDEMANKQEFLMGFRRRSLDTDQMEEKDFSIDPRKGVEKDKEVNLLNNFPETHDKTDPDFVLETKYSSKERGSEDSNVLNDKHTEEMIQELCDFLPVWVSQDQILDLLTRSGGNIVEAVSDFYERETEYQEQAVACRNSSDISQKSSLSVSASLPELVPDKGTSHGSLRSTLSQEKKSPIIKHSVKTTVSPRKRGSALQSKPNKKGKSSSKLEPIGSKQSTITKFFSKLSPNASQVHGVGSATTSGQCPNSENLLPHDAIEPYKEELDQFLQVVDGRVSTVQAASILAKANGDINLALDAYYNSGDEINNREERLAFCSKLAQVQSVNKCSGGNLKDSSETKNMTSLCVRGLSTCNVAANLVSLSLERYSPVEHACWNAGQPAPYLHLARTFDLMEAERGKTKATGILCNMFRSLLALSPEDVLPAVYLCTNKIAADHENMVMLHNYADRHNRYLLLLVRFRYKKSFLCFER